ASIHELKGCVAHGKDEASAIKHVRSMQKLWLEDALESSGQVPEPEVESEWSGKWVQRVPKKLHRDLAVMAKDEGVSLNQLVTSMLSEGMATRSCIKSFQVFLAETTMHHDAHSGNTWWLGSPLGSAGSASNFWSIQGSDLKTDMVAALANVKHM